MNVLVSAVAALAATASITGLGAGVTVPPRPPAYQVDLAAVGAGGQTAHLGFDAVALRGYVVVVEPTANGLLRTEMSRSTAHPDALTTVNLSRQPLTETIQRGSAAPFARIVVEPGATSLVRLPAGS